MFSRREGRPFSYASTYQQPYVTMWYFRRKKIIPYCRRPSGVRNWDDMTASGRHPSRCAGHCGIPDEPLTTRIWEDNAGTSHTIYRTMKPIENFLRNSPHVLKHQNIGSILRFGLGSSVLGDRVRSNLALSDAKIMPHCHKRSRNAGYERT